MTAATASSWRLYARGEVNKASLYALLYRWRLRSLKLFNLTGVKTVGDQRPISAHPSIPHEVVRQSRILVGLVP